MTGRETRDIQAFERIVHRGIGEVRISQGERAEVAVEAPEHVRPRLITVAAGGTLTLGYHHDWFGWFDWLWRPCWSYGSIIFHITVTKLTGLRLSGAGKVEISRLETDRLELVLSGAGSLGADEIETGAMEIKLSGAGSIRVNALSAGSLRTVLSSAGSVEIGSGRVGEQQIALSGAGNYHGGGLQSQAAKVRITGIGNATLSAAESLEAEISGFGKVLYHGQPRIIQKVTGLGRVESLGERC